MTAVKKISFSFKKGERFILLGLNGAGKSTTFKMLTAEEEASSGNLKVNGLNMQEILESPEKMSGVIGYCPQTNPIWDNFTVYETLSSYAKLRGIKKSR